MRNSGIIIILFLLLIVIYTILAWIVFKEAADEINKTLDEYDRQTSLFTHDSNGNSLDACMGIFY